MRVTGVTQPLEATRGRTWKRVLQYARTKPLGTASGVVLLGLMALAIGAPLLAPYDPYAHDLNNIWSGPDTRHLLGTDQYGRDTLSRLLLGARYSLLIAFAATLGGGTAGALLGLASGYFGGSFDLIIQRLVDIQMSIPPLLLTLLVVTAVGPSVPGVIVALSIAGVARATRVIRSVVLSTKEMTFVEAARAIGAGNLRIMFLHVLPSCVAPYIVILSVSIGGLIVAEASLGFLGLGVQPPTPTWGQMLNRAMDAIRLSPWVPFFPGLAIAITVFAFNMLGDAMRDILDPKLRGR